MRIETEDLGALEGIIRWMHNGRVGIQFDPNSNARAQVSSYFRFFHREIRPVLARKPPCLEFRHSLDFEIVGLDTLIARMYAGSRSNNCGCDKPPAPYRSA